MSKTAKKSARSKIKVRALSPLQTQRYQDARWAQQDKEIQLHYPGEFVVPYQGKILAHGKDAAKVLAEAARLCRRPPHELSLVGIIDPMKEIPQ